MVINKRKSVIGQGVRVERHDPEVVAATVAAKEKLATLDETVRVEQIDKLTALKATEREAHEDMLAAQKVLDDARMLYLSTMETWVSAHLAVKQEENMQ